MTKVKRKVVNTFIGGYAKTSIIERVMKENEFTRTEMAEYLNCTPKSISNWIYRGVAPIAIIHELGGKVLKSNMTKGKKGTGQPAIKRKIVRYADDAPKKVDSERAGFLERIAALEKKVVQLNNPDRLDEEVTAAIDTLNQYLLEQPKSVCFWIDWDNRRIVLTRTKTAGQREILYP